MNPAELDKPASNSENGCFEAVRPLACSPPSTYPVITIGTDPHTQIKLLLKLLGASEATIKQLQRQGPFDTRLLDRASKKRYLNNIQVRENMLTHAMLAAESLSPLCNPVAPNEPWCNAELPPEFVIGPPGTTLSMFFSSTDRLFGALYGTAGVSLVEADQQLLEIGLHSWQERFGLPAKERKSVAGAVLTGVVDRLIRTLSCDPADSRTNERLGRFAEERFSELLDIADLLALENDEDTQRCALDYHEHERSWRARRLLRHRIKYEPACAATQALLARVLNDGDRYKEALRAYQCAVELEPDAPQHHHALGLAALGRLEFERAITSLERACDLSNGIATAHADLVRARQLQGWLQAAEEPDYMPGVDLDENELANGQFHPDTLAVATELYRRHGTLRIGGAFDPAVIARCRDQFLHEYRHYFTDEKKADALQIGNRRFQVSITLAGAFNDSELYANPFVLALIRRLLGKRMVIGSTVCATSLPGAKDQHWHKDHRALFTQHKNDTPPDIPPVAITTMIPLVDLDEQIGTTVVRKGSHRVGEHASARLSSQVPIVPAGSCFLMDLSLSHKGQGNRRDQVRPIINMVYHQSWFNDNKNFKLQRPLHVPPEEFQRMPEEHRGLVDWAIQPGPLVNK